MDAASLTPEGAQELARLRRRAYAPDADIHGDSEALARLRELEDLARPEPVASDDAESPGEVDTTTDTPAEAFESRQTGSGTPPSSRSAGPPELPQDPPDTVSDTLPAAKSRPLWRRPAVWAVAGVSLLVGAAIGVGAFALTLPRPDATLRIDAQSAERGPDWDNTLSSWGMQPGSAVPYQEFNGLRVWTTLSSEGAPCILLAQEMPFWSTCAAPGLEPVIDYRVFPGQDIALDSPWPNGTIVRFIARDGAIDVWVRTPSGTVVTPDAAAAGSTSPDRRDR